MLNLRRKPPRKRERSGCDAAADGLLPDYFLAAEGPQKFPGDLQLCLPHPTPAHPHPHAHRPPTPGLLPSGGWLGTASRTGVHGHLTHHGDNRLHALVSVARRWCRCS